MTDEVLIELWNAKNDIAKEYGYSIERLAEHYLQKQAAGSGRFHQGDKVKKAEQVAPADS